MPFQPPRHQPPGLRAYQQRVEYDRQRGNDFYRLSPWRKLRAAHLAAHPLCEHCLKRNIIRAATDVHHILSRTARPDLALDPANLESLDHACHSRLTASAHRGTTP